MLDQLLGGAKNSIISDLTSKLGLNAGQAGGFLQKGLALLEGALKGGKLDVATLLSGNASAVTSKLDMSSLASFTGGDTAKAKTGMESILGPLMSNLKGNAGAADMLGQLSGGGGGGLMGQASGLAGKLFGKG